MESEFSKTVRRGLHRLACCGGTIGHHFDCDLRPSLTLFEKCKKPDCLICMMEARHRRTE